jgi:hypothetical protein
MFERKELNQPESLESQRSSNRIDIGINAAVSLLIHFDLEQNAEQAVRDFITGSKAA